MDADQVFDANLAALRERSPEAAEAVAHACRDAGTCTVQTLSGEAVLVRDGRALDSRRDPASAAARQVEPVHEPSVVLAGLGSGYVAEALLRRGIEIGAVIESDAGVVRAAMESRDLRAVLRRVPLVLASQIRTPLEVARLRRRAPAVFAHAPSLAFSPALQSLVDRWDRLKVAHRRPRVLVVGPIYGGSLGVAGAMARACADWGAETRYFDASEFAHAHRALQRLEQSGAGHGRLVAALVDLASDAALALAEDWKPDAMLALAQAPLGRAALDRLRELGVTTAMWFVENSRVLRYWREYARHYDWFYAIQPGPFLEELSGAGSQRPRYLPMACAPDAHRAVCLTAGERAEFGARISFAGTPYLNRLRLFQALVDFDLRVWGPGWGQTVLKDCAGGGGREFTTEEMIRIFCATAVNLNLHSANHVDGLDPEPDYVNPRTFEIAACGAFQLVDDRWPLRELFSDNEMATFRNLPELRTLTAHYLAHEAERAEMAGRARIRALAEHTYLHRAGRILEDMLPPELAAAAGAAGDGEALPDALARCERESPAMTRFEALARVVRQVGEGMAVR
jgi:spore maturation protein CgeB